MTTDQDNVQGTLRGTPKGTVSREASGVAKKRRKVTLLALWGRYRRKPSEERRLLRESLVLSAATRFAILFLPFRVLRRMMDVRELDLRDTVRRGAEGGADAVGAINSGVDDSGVDKSEVNESGVDESKVEESGVADAGFDEVGFREIEDPAVRQVVTAILAVSRHVPWEATCLVQAASTLIMLKRRGALALLWLGVRMKPDGSMNPHAWVTSGRQVIIGGGEIATYTPVAVFQ